MERFSKEDLARNSGKNEAPAYIAYKSIVYDVSGSFLWKNGKHQVTHSAGADLTDELMHAPHGVEVLERFQAVGVME